MMLWAGAGALVLACFISILATSLCRRLAVRVGMVDLPGRHKAHAGAIPLLGGSAILGAILGPALLALALASIWTAQGLPSWLPASLSVHIPGVAAKAPMALGILAGAFVLHVVGIVDDRKALGPWTKLLAQLGVAIPVVLLCNLRVLTVAGEPISAILSVLWLVVIINAFKFLDSMDGLCAGVAAICCAGLLAASYAVGQLFVPALLCLMLGALVGFLFYNFPPARIFMGDGGSLVVGYLMGVASLLTTYVSPSQPYYLYGIFVPLVLLAVPLYDTLSVVVLRIRERVNPMVGDRRHFSHRLIKRGMSPRKAVLTIYLCTGVTAMAAVLLTHVDNVGAVLVFAQTFAVLLIIAMLESSDSR